VEEDMRVQNTFLKRISRRGFRNLVSGMLALALTLLAGLSNAQVSFAADTVGVCNFVGNGTADNPFEIGSENNLQCLRDNLGYTAVHYYFVQTHDIVLTQIWHDGIGAGSYPFKGVYDGQNYLISGLVIEDGVGTDHDKVGLFDSLADEAVITQIELDSPRITFTQSGVASGSIGLLAGSANCATISYVAVVAGQMNIDSLHVSHIGGFTGYSCGEITTSGVHDTEIIVSAPQGGYNVGGFVGTADSGAQISYNSISNSTIDGDFGADINNFGGYVGQLVSSTVTTANARIDVHVTTDSGELFWVGGLVGSSGSYNPALDPQSVISSSSHTGSVTAISGQGAVYGVGGVGGGSTSTTISNVVSTGQVTAQNLDWEVVGVGGLWGILGDHNCNPDSDECSLRSSELTDGTHTGNIETASTHSSPSGVGGQVGVVVASSVANTTSSGDISVDAGGAEIYNVGGAVGNSVYSTLTNARSGPGTISILQDANHTTFNLGGVVGTSTHSDLTRISSSNVIWADSRLRDPDSSQYSEGAGGLAGSLQFSTIESGFFSGEVYGVNLVGGIAGVNESSSVTNISVTGNVDSPGAAALFGYLYTDYAVLVEPLLISKVIFSGEISTNSEPVLINDFMTSDNSILSRMEFVVYQDAIDLGWLDEDFWDVVEVTALPKALLKIQDAYPQIETIDGGFDIFSGFEPTPVSNNVTMAVWGICEGTSYPFLRSLTTSTPCTGVSPSISFTSIHVRENVSITSPIALSPSVSGLNFSGNGNGGGLFWNEMNLPGCDAIPSGINLSNEWQWSAAGYAPVPIFSHKPGFNTSGTYNLCFVYQDDFGKVALGNFTLVVDPLIPALTVSNTTIQHGESLVLSDNLSVNKTLAVFVDGVRSVWRASSNGTNLTYNWSQWGDATVHTVIFRIYDVAFTGVGSGPSLSTAYAASQTITWASYVAPTPSPSPSANPSPSASPSASPSSSPSASPSPSPTPAQPASRSISLAAAPGALVAGSNVNYEMQNLQVGSSWNLTLRSTPQVLQSGQVGNTGGVNQTAIIPSGLEPGWHSLTFYGVDSSGNQVESVLWFRVSTSGLLLETTTSPTAAQLAQTGSHTGLYVSVASVFLILGVVLVMWRRRLVLVPKGSQ